MNRRMLPRGADRARPRTATLILAATALAASGAVGVSLASGDPAARQRPSAGATAPIAGPPDPAGASTRAVRRLRSLDDQLDASVLTETARTVPAPGGRGTWTVADTSTGGACAALWGGVSFCEPRPDRLAAGAGRVDVYPPDRILRVAADGRSVQVRPSTRPGLRHGFAPAGATAVTVRVDGKPFSRAAVTDRMFTVRIPPQGTPSRSAFTE